MVGPCPRIRSHRATLRRCDFSAIRVEKGGEAGFSSGGATPWRSRPCAACGACMSTWFGGPGSARVHVTTARYAFVGWDLLRSRDGPALIREAEGLFRYAQRTSDIHAHGHLQWIGRTVD